MERNFQFRHKMCKNGRIYTLQSMLWQHCEKCGDGALQTPKIAKPRGALCDLLTAGWLEIKTTPPERSKQMEAIQDVMKKLPMNTGSVCNYEPGMSERMKAETANSESGKLNQQ